MKNIMKLISYAALVLTLSPAFFVFTGKMEFETYKFWVLIGTNDLGTTSCTPDIVILGVIRIVEELRMRMPSATVVINGLLPRTSDHSAFLMQSKDKNPVLWPFCWESWEE